MSLTDTPVAARPLIRELAEWRLFLPFAGRVIALQGSHPTVAAGIYDHSSIFSDPLGRAKRTLEYAERILFDADRAGAATEIRELHRDIKGVRPDGKPYHAWNREAWTWVHLTTFEATLYGLRAIHGRMSTVDLEAAYADARAVGVLYGVRAEDMPEDIRGLREYIRDGIETKLTFAPEESLGELVRNLRRPPKLPIPAAMWRTLSVAASQPAHILVFGSFPSTIRRRWGIRWTPLHEAAYQAQLVALRTAPAPLPDRLRMLPYAYRALHPRAA